MNIPELFDVEREIIIRNMFDDRSTG